MPAVFASAVIAMLLTSQSGGTGSAEERKAPVPNPQVTSLTLSGCISTKPGSSGQFTFQDVESGSRYRLQGKGLRKYAGQMVEIVGGAGGRRFSIKGGLYPSPNTAARAGDLDPAKAAIATLPGGAADAPGGAELPEFRVSRVRATAGTCE